MTTTTFAPPPVGTKLRSPLLYVPTAVVGLLPMAAGLAWDRLWFGLVWAVVAVEHLTFAWWFGVTLTEHEAVVDGVRRRRIPWSEVQGVSVERYLGATRVVIWTPEQKLRVRAPTTSWGIGRQRFERDYQALGQFWLAHRGADWQPQPWRG